MKRVKKRKGIEAHRVKHPTPSQATDALIGDEEQNGKPEENKNKETGSGSPTQPLWTIQSPLMTHRDHTVSLFFLPSPLPDPQCNSNGCKSKIPIN